MRQFETLFLESLENAAPKRYAAMKAAGTLLPTARKLAERAGVQYEHLLSERMRADPGPKPALERAQHLLAMDGQIREVVVEELLEPVRLYYEEERPEDEEDVQALEPPDATM